MPDAILRTLHLLIYLVFTATICRVSPTLQMRKLKHRNVKQHARDYNGRAPDLNIGIRGFPGGAVVKNPPASAGDMGLSPGPGRSYTPRSN